MRIEIKILLISILLKRVSSVEPIRKGHVEDITITSEMNEMKSMLSSVQGSLITSVALIQGIWKSDFIFIIHTKLFDENNF